MLSRSPTGPRREGTNDAGPHVCARKPQSLCAPIFSVRFAVSGNEAMAVTGQWPAGESAVEDADKGSRIESARDGFSFSARNHHLYRLTARQELTAEETATLTPAQKDAVENAVLPANGVQTAAGAATVIGEALVFFAVIFFVGGRLGWLLVMKKKVPCCTNCARSSRPHRPTKFVENPDVNGSPFRGFPRGFRIAFGGRILGCYCGVSHSSSLPWVVVRGVAVLIAPWRPALL